MRNALLDHSGERRAQLEPRYLGLDDLLLYGVADGQLRSTRLPSSTKSSATRPEASAASVTSSTSTVPDAPSDPVADCGRSTQTQTAVATRASTTSAISALLGGVRGCRLGGGSTRPSRCSVPAVVVVCVV
jgi:hypothetical protein